MADCTSSEVFDRMGYTDAIATALISRVDDAIEAATVAIDNDCHRSFTAVPSEARTFGVSRSGEFELSVPDLRTVSALKIDDDGDGVFETTIAAAGYELDKPFSDAAWPYETIRLLDRLLPSSGRRRVRVEVTGTWGWDAVPAPINQACSLLAAQLSQRPASALFGIQSFGELGAQGIRATDPTYEKLIGKYRRIGIA